MKQRSNATQEDMLRDIAEHPVRAYFRYPLGKDACTRLPGWWEGPQAFYDMVESVCICAVVGALLVVRAILLGPLRPAYKAYLVVKWHVHFKRRGIKGQKRKDGHI